MTITMEDSPFLDRLTDIEMHYSDNLPHWHQNEKMQFVTFRLADSLPKSQICELLKLKHRFEEIHPKPWSRKTGIEYQKLIGRRCERLLDNGYGSCVLRDGRVQKILSDSILHFNNDRYYVIAFVVMPNHVHLLIQPIGDNKLDDIIRSIKRHSAREINRTLNRDGSLWMKRYFDRIVRNENAFKHYVSYIINNPMGLPPRDYYLYTSW